MISSQETQDFRAYTCLRGTPMLMQDYVSSNSNAQTLLLFGGRFNPLCFIYLFMTIKWICLHHSLLDTILLCWVLSCLLMNSRTWTMRPNGSHKPGALLLCIHGAEEQEQMWKLLWSKPAITKVLSHEGISGNIGNVKWSAGRGPSGLVVLLFFNFESTSDGESTWVLVILHS